MAELLLKAVDATHSNPTKDAAGCYKRGHIVVVMPDGHEWGLQERLPKFALLKFPLVPVNRVEKYIAQQEGVRRRRWRLRWADLPAQARNRLMNTGQLVIKARAEYAGEFDYTWAQVRDYFRNDETGLNETQDP
jgi:hypothetical protein